MTAGTTGTVTISGCVVAQNGAAPGDKDLREVEGVRLGVEGIREVEVEGVHRIGVNSQEEGFKVVILTTVLFLCNEMSREQGFLSFYPKIVWNLNLCLISNGTYNGFISTFFCCNQILTF